MNHDSRRLGIPSRFRLFGTRSSVKSSLCMFHLVSCEARNGLRAWPREAMAETSLADNARALGHEHRTYFRGLYLELSLELPHPRSTTICRRLCRDSKETR